MAKIDKTNRDSENQYYGLWNDWAKEWQFGIVERTAEAATQKAWDKLGNDFRKWRFEIKKMSEKTAEKVMEQSKQYHAEIRAEKAERRKFYKEHHPKDMFVWANFKNKETKEWSTRYVQVDGLFDNYVTFKGDYSQYPISRLYDTEAEAKEALQKHLEEAAKMNAEREAKLRTAVKSENVAEVHADNDVAEVRDFDITD